MSSAFIFFRQRRLRLAIVFLVFLALPAIAYAAWSSAKRLTNNNAIDFSPNLVSEGNNLHLLGRQLSSGSDTTASLFYRKKAGSNPWPSPTRIATNSLIGSSLAADNGKAFAVYDFLDGGNSDIAFKTNRSGSWSSARNLTKNSSANDSLPCIARNNDDIFVVYERDMQSSDSELFFCRSQNNGQTWSSPSALTNNSIEDFSPQVAADANGNFHLVWSTTGPNGTSIKYRKFSNNAWGNVRTVINSSSIMFFDPVIDVRGTTPCISFCSLKPSGANGIRFAFLNSSNSWQKRTITSHSSFSIFDVEPTIDVGPNGAIATAWTRIDGLDGDIWNATWNNPTGTLTFSAVTDSSNANEYGSDFEFNDDSDLNLVYSKETSLLPAEIYQRTRVAWFK